MDALALIVAGAGEQDRGVDALVQPLDALADAFEAIVAGNVPAF
jgi:hypothetical protein